MTIINSEDSHRFADGTTLSFRKANAEGETLKSKKVDQQTLVEYKQPVKRKDIKNEGNSRSEQ